MVLVPNVENCNAIKLKDDDYTCCYYTYKEDGEEIKDCIPVKKNKVSKVIDDIEDEDGYTDVSIDCSSNYISNALLILLSLLF